MHPKRKKMINIALQVLPFSTGLPICALDLGTGTGFFSLCFLQKFSQANIIAIDGAEAMVDLARIRLGKSVANVDFRIGDFLQLEQLITDREKFDVIYSSYALHHLNCKDKLKVIKQVFTRLKPRGWFLNADIIIAGQPEIEQRIQEIRVEGIVKRASGKDHRFTDSHSTRKFLDELEANEGDQPLSLLEDLQILKEAGFEKHGVFWTEYREAVIGGIK